MPVFLLLASALLVAVGVAHSALGEWKLLGPMLAPERRSGLLEKSAFARQTLRFAWHLTTIAWFGAAGVLAAAAVSPTESLGRAIAAVSSATFLVTGLMILVASRGRHLAWPVFLVIAALCAGPWL